MIIPSVHIGELVKPWGDSSYWFHRFHKSKITFVIVNRARRQRLPTKRVASNGKALIFDRVVQHSYIILISPYPRSRAGNIGEIVVPESLSKFLVVDPIKRFTANVLTESF